MGNWRKKSSPTGGNGGGGFPVPSRQRPSPQPARTRSPSTSPEPEVKVYEPVTEEKVTGSSPSSARGVRHWNDRTRHRPPRDSASPPVDVDVGNLKSVHAWSEFAVTSTSTSTTASSSSSSSSSPSRNSIFRGRGSGAGAKRPTPSPRAGDNNTAGGGDRDRGGVVADNDDDEHTDERVDVDVDGDGDDDDDGHAGNGYNRNGNRVARETLSASSLSSPGGSPTPARHQRSDGIPGSPASSSAADSSSGFAGDGPWDSVIATVVKDAEAALGALREARSLDGPRGKSAASIKAARHHVDAIAVLASRLAAGKDREKRQKQKQLQKQRSNAHVAGPGPMPGDVVKVVAERDAAARLAAEHATRAQALELKCTLLQAEVARLKSSSAAASPRTPKSPRANGASPKEARGGDHAVANGAGNGANDSVHNAAAPTATTPMSARKSAAGGGPGAADPLHHPILSARARVHGHHMHGAAAAPSPSPRGDRSFTGRIRNTTSNSSFNNHSNAHDESGVSAKSGGANTTTSGNPGCHNHQAAEHAAVVERLTKLVSERDARHLREVEKITAAHSKREETLARRLDDAEGARAAAEDKVRQLELEVKTARANLRDERRAHKSELKGAIAEGRRLAEAAASASESRQASLSASGIGSGDSSAGGHGDPNVDDLRRRGEIAALRAENELLRRHLATVEGNRSPGSGGQQQLSHVMDESATLAVSEMSSSVAGGEAGIAGNDDGAESKDIYSKKRNNRRGIHSSGPGGRARAKPQTPTHRPIDLSGVTAKVNTSLPEELRRPKSARQPRAQPSVDTRAREEGWK